MEIDVSQAVGHAFRHMTRVLFRPFKLRKWLALALVSFFAYGGGGYYSNFPSNWGNSGSGNPFPPDAVRWITQHLVLIALIFGGLVILGFVLSWLSSVLKFVYIDEIIRNTAEIAGPFKRLMGRGTSYFLWTLIYGLVVIAMIMLLIVLPLVLVFIPGLGAPLWAKVGAVIWAVGIGIPLLILSALIDLFARDFVVAAMYVRGVGVMDGWRTVLPILRAHPGQILLYILLLFALSLGFGAASILAAGLMLVVLAIPFGLLALIVYLLVETMGFGWNPATIGTAVGLGIFALIAWLYSTQVVLQPIWVFRRAYALIVLGQADPSLETIPAELPPPPPSE